MEFRALSWCKENGVCGVAVAEIALPSSQLINLINYVVLIDDKKYFVESVTIKDTKAYLRVTPYLE